MPDLRYQLDGRWITYAVISDEVVIGRAPDCDLVINNPRVSRHHAKIFRQRDEWRVEDLGSSNGTRINDLGHTDRALRGGDRILLHNFPVLFEDVPETSFLLSSPELAEELGQGTVFRPAVDFNALASVPGEQAALGDDARIGKLLSVLTTVSHALLSSPSLDATLEQVLGLVFQHLEVKRGCILLWDEQEQTLVPKCVRDETGAAHEIRFSRTIAERVYRDKVAVLTTDAQSDDRFVGGESILIQGIHAAMAAPLWNADKVEGIIYVDTQLRGSLFDHFDLDLLSALGNHVAIAIDKARMQESIMQQQMVRRRLERYHSPAVVDRIATMSRSDTDGLVADEREVTVLFADVVGFTDRCESMRPKEIAEILNRYFSEMAEMIFRHEGTLDKFIGDCLMAVFGAPIATEDHALRAAESVLDMRDALVRLNRGVPEAARLEFRVGMHSGRAVAGDIGSVRRSDYTVLGATVNLAARLESTVARPGQIVISDATRDLLQDRYDTRLVGEHKPKGISRDVRCYELVGRRESGA